MSQFLQGSFLSRKHNSVFLVGLIMFLLPKVGWGQSISISTIGSAYNQNFNTLASSGSTNLRSTLPLGWTFIETGTGADDKYAAGTGSGTSGDTYSFGTNSDRALGCLQSGSVIPIIGASFTNNTGTTITSLEITYVGEMYRLGATGRTDRLDFQYSTTATGLNTGSFSDFDLLDFTAPVMSGTVGVLDGNLVTSKRTISQTITGLNIASGTTFWIRWNDFNPSGADDGLAIDDFSIVANGNAVAPTIGAPTLSGTAPYCANATINVKYTPTGTFNSGNTFTAQLSDATGSFTSPLASVNGTGTNDIALAIPTNAIGATGTNYKIRVIASDPATVGSESAPFTITAIPAANKPTITGAQTQTITTNSAGTPLIANAPESSDYSWQYISASGGSTYTPIAGATSATFTPAGANFLVAGIYNLVVVATSKCGSVVGTSDPVVITVNQETAASSKIIAVSGTEAVSISSIINTKPISSNAHGTEVWQFTLTDGDGSTDDDDNLPTIYKTIELVPNTGNTVTNWSAVIEDLQFFDISSGNLITGPVAVNAGNVLFTPGSPISVADGIGAFKTIGVRLSLKASLPANSDEKLFAFKISNTNVTVENLVSSSQLAVFSAVSDNTKNKIDVAATKLEFVTQPVAVMTGTTMPSVTVKAIDQNGNIDVNFNTGIEMAVASGSAALSVSPLLATPVNGVATFNTISFTTGGTGVTLAATRTGTNDWAVASKPFTVTLASPTLTLKLSTASGFFTNNGSPYNFSGNQNVGVQSGNATFTIGNSGNSTLVINSITASQDFEIVSAPTSVTVGGTGTLRVAFKPTTVGPITGTVTIVSNDMNQNPFILNLTGTGVPNTDSDLISTFVYPTNIDYTAHQTLANGLAVFGFTIRDGGAASDADALPTILESVKFTNVQNSGFIREAALFSGGNLVASTNLIGTSIDFSSLPTSGPNAIVAPDNGSVDVQLVVAFNSAITDKQQLRFTLTNANCKALTGNTSSAIKSTGTLTSSTTGDNNRIAVTGTTLKFIQQPSDVVTNVNMAPAVTLELVDTNNNRDLDGTVSITANGVALAGATNTAMVNGSGIFTFNALSFNNSGTGVTLVATIGNLTATSDFFDVVPGPDKYQYRSRASGNWNNITAGTETWERSLNGVSWVPVTTSADVPRALVKEITIRNNHVVTVTSSTNADQLTIDAGGTLIINNITFTLENGAGTDLVVNGTLHKIGTLTQTLGSETIFNAGSLYQHNAPGNPFGVIPTATWDANSTVEIVKVGSTNPTINEGLTQSFGNFKWNFPGQIFGAQMLGIYPSEIKGDLEIIDTGSGSLRFGTTQGLDLTIGGNVIVRSRNVLVTSTTGSGNPYKLEVGGNFIVENGASFQHNNTTTPLTLIFKGNNKNFNNAGSLTVENIIFNVNPGATLNLLSDLTFVNRSMKVEGRLNTNNNIVSGSGTFTLSAGATLGIGSPDGISAQGTNTGNILTTTRNFENANYVYNGTAPQVTGSGLPAIVAGLTVHNPAGVTLQAPVEVKNLELAQGKLTTTAALATIAVNGSVNSPAEQTSYVDGPLAQKVDAASKTLNFPIGKGANARPLTLKIVSQDAGENTYTAEQFEGAYAPNPAAALPPDVTHISKIRYFNISQSRTQAVVTANVKLTYAADDDVKEPSKLTVVKYSGTTATDLFVTELGAGTIKTGDFTSFSTFVLANTTGGNNPLPVELLSFAGNAKENAIVLTWETASEKNSSHFDVQRSLDGHHFETIGQVKAAGHSQVLKRYAFNDQNPRAALAYYRLKQVDLDGTTAYSAIIQISPARVKGSLTVYPNPAQDKLTVVFGGTTAAAELQVVNLLGQVVKTIHPEAANPTLELSLTGLPAGSYYLKTPAGETVKFIKVN